LTIDFGQANLLMMIVIHSSYRPAFLGTDYLVVAVVVAAGSAVCLAADCAGDSTSRGSLCFPAR